MFIASRVVSSWDPESLIPSTTFNYSYHPNLVLFIASRALISRIKVIDVNHNLESFIVSKALSS